MIEKKGKNLHECMYNNNNNKRISGDLTREVIWGSKTNLGNPRHTTLR